MTNTTQRRGVLFVHQEAERTGAAMSLLHLLRWLNANGHRPFSLLLCEGGQLLPQFAELARTEIASKSRWCPGGLRAKAARAIGLSWVADALERGDLRKSAAPYSPGLIYLNGFSSENFRLIELLDLGVPILTHVHELGFLFRRQAQSAMPRMLSRTHRFIACSGAVRDNLIREHRIEASKIEVVHESIPVSSVRARRSREDLLRELNFPSDALIVMACGAGGWNKGTDVFFWLAKSVCKEREQARFVWVGNLSESIVSETEHDMAKSGLGGRLRFTGLVAEPADYISVADVFVLPSREDSFPLVCLEAAALAKPIVCFADAGGMPEFIENDAGFVVPYLDVEAMANRVVSLLDSVECRGILGETARRKVNARHDVRSAAPRIAEIIEASIVD